MLTNEEFHKRYREIITARYTIRGKHYAWADYAGSAHPTVEKTVYYATKRLLKQELGRDCTVQVKDGKIFADLEEIGYYVLEPNPRYKEESSNEKSQ